MISLIKGNTKLAFALCFVVIVISTLLVFDQVLQGKQINNSAYLYAFEPWAHYATPEVGRYNYVLSDDMDAMSISYPTRDLLAQGKFAFWNRFWQLGIPEFRIDSGWFYPLRIFWVILGTPLGMTTEVLLRFIAGAIFTFLLLELLGVRRLIAMVCALGYAFGSNSIGDYMYGFGPPGLTLPIVLYFLERVIRFGTRRDIVFLTLSLMLLNTYIMVHVNAVISLWVGAYAVLRILSERCAAAVVGRLALAMFFAPLLFAFALVPTLDFYLNYFNDAYRTEYFAAQLKPGALLSLFFNKFFGDPLLEPARFTFGTYVNTGIFIGFLTGTVGLALSLLRLLFKPDKITCIVLGLTALMAMTIYDFGFESVESLLGSIPLVQSIRPFYQKPVFQFFLMLLGALGLNHFIDLGKKQWLQLPLAVVIIFGVQLLSSYYFNLYYQRNGSSESLWQYFQFYNLVHIALIGLLFLVHPVLRHWFGGFFGSLLSVAGSISIIMLTVLESRDAAQSWIPYSQLRAFYPKTETTYFVRRRLGNGRVVSLDRAAVPGLLYGYRIPIAAGRSLPRPPYLELLRLAYPSLHLEHPTQSLFPLAETNLTSPIWDLVNVRMFIAGKGIDVAGLRARYGDRIVIHEFNDGTVIERRGAARGYIAAYETVTAAEPKQTRELIEAGLDIRRTIVVDPSLGAEGAESPCREKMVKVHDFEVELDLIKATVINSCPAFFMPSIFVDRGWTAYVDGKRQPIHKGYGFMPVVKIETPGTHKIEFRYFPRGVRYGGLVSIISATIFLLILWRRK